MRIETALSVRQPWAWLILNAGKDVENRTWETRFRGWCLLHASKGMTVTEYFECQKFLLSRELFDVMEKLPLRKDLQRGGIVGAIRIDDCVAEFDSPYFVGPFGFVIGKAVPLPFHECKGALGFFRVENSPIHVENDVVTVGIATGTTEIITPEVKKSAREAAYERIALGAWKPNETKI